MDTRIEIEDMRLGYIDVIDWVVTSGEETSPRGQDTSEILGAQIILHDVTRSLPVGIDRWVNSAFAAVEAAQLIAGVSTPRLVTSINPNMEQFMDGSAFHGAYGPRIRRALPHAVNKLKDDRDTRQAVLSLYSANEDLVGRPYKDIPCTCTLQFMIRNDRLVMHTHMRSNDVWWGLAYDAFQFTQLQLTICNVLGIEPGLYYHNANSLHVYHRDLDAIEALNRNPELNSPAFQPQEAMGFSGSTIEAAMDNAWSVLHCDLPDDATPSEEWYLDKLWP